MLVLELHAFSSSSFGCFYFSSSLFSNSTIEGRTHKKERKQPKPKRRNYDNFIKIWL